MVNEHEDPPTNNNNTSHNNINSTIKNPILDQSSSYYLHPAENLYIVLVTPPLSENNYESWRRSMKHTFLSKNEIKFINRKITPPTEYGPLFDIWERCNNIVIAWISVQSTIYVDNAAQLWTDLHNRFSKIDHFRLSYLLQQIHYMRQGEKSITTYFNELKTL